MANAFKVVLLSILVFSANGIFANGGELNHSEIEVSSENHESVEGHGKEKEGNWVLHHVKDAHDIHLAGEFAVPLPVILWTNNGLVTFMSSEFHHDDTGHHVVEKNGMSFVKMHEKIYQLTSGSHTLELDSKHLPTNAIIPLDFSITKVVVAIFLVAFIMFFVFKSVANKYKGDKPQAPRGIASWMEPLVLFVRDFAKENIGEKKYMKFMPYLLTVFFFIWFGNLLGLIPFIGGINMTGNISVTLMLALMTLCIQIIHSKWAFWKHMLMPPGVPWPLWIILVPIELMGVLIKPAALTIRLFANITAGHIIVLSIIGIIFMNHNMAWAGLSVPLALFISVLEVTLVAFLQAYIFTMLSAMFIGTAVDEGHH
jgi:F-type H+-transporting ATPase subunit a